MENTRTIHPDFQYYLGFKNKKLIDTYTDLRAFILSLYPESNELLYHTHALTSAYCISEKVSDCFCLLPIYTNHVNLGFSKGTLLKDPHKLLKGTGKLMRHIPIKNTADYRNQKVEALIKSAITFAIGDMDTETKKTGLTISKIKRDD